eukprot:2252567-Amphidinium_carterae.2
MRQAQLRNKQLHAMHGNKGSRLLFGNITAWRSKESQIAHLMSQDFDHLALAEMNLKDTHHKAARSFAREHGWHAHFSHGYPVAQGR